jgi:hypothetical protein
MNDHVLCIWHKEPPSKTWIGKVKFEEGEGYALYDGKRWFDPSSYFTEDLELREKVVAWLEITDKEAVSKESFDSCRMQAEDYEHARGREFFAKQILSEIDSGKTAQEIALICLREIRRCHRKEIDKEREKLGLPPVDWSKVP